MTRADKFEEIFGYRPATDQVLCNEHDRCGESNACNYCIGNPNDIGREEDWWSAEYKEPTTKNDLSSGTRKNSKKLEKDFGELDCISRADALRVAKNEYLRGWHNALCKALSEKYSIHCEEGNFSVIQEETITGLGLSMDCALGKDVESYMNTMPSVTPQEPILDKIRAEIERGKIGLDIEFNGGIDYALCIIDKYKAESEG